MLVQLAPFLFGLFYGSGFVIVSECMLVCAISVCVFAHSLISKVIKSLFFIFFVVGLFWSLWLLCMC